MGGRGNLPAGKPCVSVRSWADQTHYPKRPFPFASAIFGPDPSDLLRHRVFSKAADQSRASGHGLAGEAAPIREAKLLDAKRDGRGQPSGAKRGKETSE